MGKYGAVILWRALPVIVLFQTITMSAFCQQAYHLKLRLTGREDSTSIPYAHIALVDQRGKVRMSGLSDINGRFVFKVADSLNGKLHISAAPLGYNTFTSTAIVFADSVMEKTVILEKQTTTLKEVTITERQVEKDGSKITYLVKQDQFSAATPIADLLTKLPNVTVVAGSVKVANRDGVLILIDGKGELKDQRNQLALLASLSSDQIEKIEINTFPPSRYDASVTAIINIITKKQKSFSNVRASVSQPFYRDDKTLGTQYFGGQASTNLNFTVDNVRVTLLFNTYSSQYPENHVTQESVYGVENFTNTINSDYASVHVAPNLTLDYDINSRSSVELNADINILSSFTTHTLEQDRFYNAANTALDSVSNVNDHYSKSGEDIELTGNYKYILNPKKKSALYVNLIYSDYPVTLADQLVNSKTTAAGDSLETILNHYTSHTTILNASIILTDAIKTPFLSTEFGLKSNSLTNGTAQQVNADSSTFHYVEQISSFFASAKWRLKKFLIVSELRGELLTSTSHFIDDTTNQSLNRDYFKLYPHLLLQETISDDLTASIGYIRNIKRPRINFLNPSSIITSYYNSITGDISNNPSYFDRIEGQLQYKDFGLTPFYQIASNQIYFQPVQGDPFESQAANLGSLHTFGMSLYKAFTWSTWASSTVNADFSETTNPTPTVQYYKNSWTGFNIDASTDITLGKEARVQTDVYYSGKTYMAYVEYGGQFYSTVTYRQLFDHDRLSCNLTVTDPLGIQKSTTTQYYAQLTSAWHDTTNGRMISVQLVYKFPFGQKFTNQTYKNQNNGEIRK